MVKKAKKKFTCMRCKKIFSSFKTLKVHSKKHLRRELLDEIKLLEKGHIPNKTKIGSEFKGKNKIILLCNLT